jgi:catechol 2,3-dioxygenase
MVNRISTAFSQPVPAPQLLPAAAELGAVHLDVTDGERAKIFWTQYVGLTEITSSPEEIRLGIEDRALIVLHPGASGSVVPRHTGLYHVAIHLPSQKELARVVGRLFGLRYPNSPTDHAETMATYFSDPDGNGVELTFETPERGSLSVAGGQGVAIMADGSTQGPTEALDVNMLLSALSDEDDLMAPMPEGTRIGHVHLHVTSLQVAREFYRDVIGFGGLRALDEWGMSDFSLDTRFVPHALAVNVWNSFRAAAKPEGTAGLRHWSLSVPTVSDMTAIVERLELANISYTYEDTRLIVDDPFSNRLQIAVS